MKSKQCELILSNLHLLDLHDIMILEISLQRSESERSEHNFKQTLFFLF